jgi:hypothetical protein
MNNNMKKVKGSSKKTKGKMKNCPHCDLPWNGMECNNCGFEVGIGSHYL